MRIFAVLKLVLILTVICRSQQFGFIKNLFDKAKKAVEEVKNIVINSFIEVINNDDRAVGGDVTITTSGCNSAQFRSDLIATSENHLLISRSWGSDCACFPERKIPYLFINNVSSEKTLMFNTIKLTLRNNPKGCDGEIKITTLNKVDTFLNKVNTFRGTIRGMYANFKNSLNSALGTFNTAKGLFVLIKNEKENNLNLIDALNQRLRQVTESLNAINKRREDTNLALQSIGLKLQSLNLKSTVSQKTSDSCYADMNAMINMRDTYVKFKNEFTPEKIYQILNKEISNLCKFHLVADDINLIVPSQAPEMQKQVEKVTRSHEIEPLLKHLDNDYYCNLSDKDN